tara:strand:+ start:254 stop:403 length:150 start_codon:yes stop_codon:yes gene_type:complete
MDILIFTIIYLIGGYVAFIMLKKEKDLIVQWCYLSWIVVFMLWIDRYNN